MGNPIRFDPSAPYGVERVRIKEYLERSISGMYRALEREHREATVTKHPHKGHKIRVQAA